MADFTLLALKQECTNDPAGIGLTAIYNALQDQTVADALNLVRAGAAYSIFRSAVPIRDLIKNIDATEYSALTQLLLAKLNLIFLGTAELDATDLNTRNIITDIFTGKPLTLANFAVVAKKQASRAEVLWGDGFMVTNVQVAQSRTS